MTELLRFSHLIACSMGMRTAGGSKAQVSLASRKRIVLALMPRAAGETGSVADCVPVALSTPLGPTTRPAPAPGGAIMLPGGGWPGAFITGGIPGICPTGAPGGPPAGDGPRGGGPPAAYGAPGGGPPAPGGGPGGGPPAAGGAPGGPAMYGCGPAPGGAAPGMAIPGGGLPAALGADESVGAPGANGFASPGGMAQFPDE